MVPLLLHLETDASLNMRRPQEQPDGSNRHFAGGGIVVRTKAMDLVQQAAVPLGFVRGIDEAEALAVLEGLRIVRGMGATGVAVRTDCLRVIDLIEDGHAETVEWRRLLGERLRAEVATFPGGVRMRWTPSFHLSTRRDGAPSADILARRAAGLGERREWRPRRRR